jgi:hypothetical protein
MAQSASGSSLLIFPRGNDQLLPLYALTRIHYCKFEFLDCLPFPISRQVGYRREQELVVYNVKSLQILPHDCHCTSTAKGNDQIYILRICEAIMKEGDVGSVRGQNPRKTNALVRFENIFEERRQVPQRVY